MCRGTACRALCCSHPTTTILSKTPCCEVLTAKFDNGKLHLMRKIEVVAYDSSWPGMYEAEAEAIGKVLKTGLTAIHHIGSTAIPGIAAKPTIDILAEVRDIEAVDLQNARLAGLGYTPMGEYGISGRRYFFKTSGEKHTFHLHVFQVGNPEIERHLLFRDYLHVHPEAASEYAALKLLLASRFPEDIFSFMNGKDALIKEIDIKAREWKYPAKQS